MISDVNSTTARVKCIRQGEQKWEYGYDKLGNITRECWQGKATTGGDIGFESDPITSAEGETLSLDLANLESRYQTTYAYDALGQLLRVNDERAGTTWTYAYDLGGNLLEKKRYAYTMETDLSVHTPAQTIPYAYDDAGWKDKLTAYDGKAITHDAIGNPLTYDGWAYTWKAGRMLHSMARGGEDAVNAQFTYDHTGLRVKKTVNGVDTLYMLNGRKITHIRKGADGASGADAVQMHFFYDAQGRPMLVRYNGTDYAYQHNLQGDIVSLVDMDGTVVVEYAYDAWGKPISTAGSMAETLGHDNPFRYRGYVWDEETGLYYLRSRYYEPSWGRFVNADTLLNRIGEWKSQSTYTYCLNNPVNRIDFKGQESLPSLELGYPDYMDSFFEGDIVLGSINPLPYIGIPFSYAHGYNSNGELYERWFGSDGLPDMDIHHSDHGNPKMHMNPHKHVWERAPGGKWSPGKPKELNESDKNKSQKKQRGVEKSGNTKSLLVRVGIAYLIFKVIVATLTAPATGGTSYAILFAP